VSKRSSVVNPAWIVQKSAHIISDLSKFSQIEEAGALPSKQLNSSASFGYASFRAFKSLEFIRVINVNLSCKKRWLKSSYIIFCYTTIKDESGLWGIWLGMANGCLNNKPLAVQYQNFQKYHKETVVLQISNLIVSWLNNIHNQKHHWPINSFFWGRQKVL